MNARRSIIFVLLVGLAVASSFYIAQAGTDSPLALAMHGAAASVAPNNTSSSTGVWPSTVSAPAVTLVVTSTANSGPGTLRACIENAVSGDTINFDAGVFPPGDPQTITLASGLPGVIVDNLTIDASNAGLILDGSRVGTTPEMLLLDDVSLALNGGPNLIANGDFSAGLGHWRPWDERLGATRSITNTDFHSLPNAYAWSTVAHAGNSRTVYDTTNTSDPADDPFDDIFSTVWITATGGRALELRFWYKYGGVGVTLYVLFPGDAGDIGGWWFDPQADWTEAIISVPLPGDAIGVGVEFNYAHSERWTTGLRINSSGNAIRGLQIVHFPSHGVVLDGGAQNNVIGGDSTVGAGPLGQSNLISGNNENGVDISGNGTMSNTISGNTIGANVNGTAALPNGGQGVRIYAGASHNLVGGVNATPGGACSGECNLISGNSEYGVQVEWWGTNNNTVSGNYIGTDIHGSAALPNGGAGVQIDDGASYNLIGGVNATPGGGCSGACNLISGNGLPYGYGVVIEGGDSSSNTVSGNTIGTDATGTVAIPNGHGVSLEHAGSYNVIGGDAVGERNVISGNSYWGVTMAGDGGSYNKVIGNLVGVGGSVSVGNGSSGIGLWYNSPDTEIRGNRVSGNGGAGIWLTGSLIAPWLRTRVIGNSVTDNAGCGIRIRSNDVLVLGNTISGNAADGIWVEKDEWFDSVENTLTTNSIYGNAGLGIELIGGANAGIEPPAIAYVNAASGVVTGTACAGCRVEIFSDDEDEGRWYEGVVTTTVGGDWSFSKGSPFTGPYVHATATDAAGNTSEFSLPLRDVAVVGAAPDGEVAVGEPVSVQVELFNLGEQVEQGVTVTCSIEDPSGSTVYDETHLSGEVQPGTWAMLDFPVWTPPGEGMHILTCQSMLPNDREPANDVYTQTVTAVLGAPDIWTKDNPRDSGDVPSGSPWWVSPDIWVRHRPDGGLIHQNPVAFTANTVYVRLRNRGDGAASGEVHLFWDRSRLGWPCKAGAPNIGTISFDSLSPGEERIISLQWEPQEVGHHGLHTIIEAEGDPANWEVPCSPHRPRYDNNISWHNVIVYAHPPRGRYSNLEVEEAEVRLVNVYNRPKDVDVILERMTFSTTGTITVQLPDDLFDRWLAYGGHWAEDLEVFTATKEIRVVGAISATIGDVPMLPSEETTMTLVFDAPARGAFELGLYERIDDLTVGGVACQWIVSDLTPPKVYATSPPNGAMAVALDVPIVVTFSEQIGPLSLNLMLTPTLGLTTTWNEAGTVVTATHADFAYGPTYMVTVTANDAAGNPMAQPASWSFTTVGHPFTITKTWAGNGVAGTAVTYTLAVTNLGSQPATVIVSDTIPAYLFGVVIEDGTLQLPFAWWQLGPIPPGGGTGTAQFNATITCTVELSIVNDDYGVRRSDLGVRGPAGAAVSFDVLTPTITVEITRTSGAIVVGDTVYFTATTRTDGPPLSYEWGFGDGITMSGVLTALHVYTRANSYLVTFTATDTCGYEESNFVEVKVNEAGYRIYLPIVLRQ